MPPKKQAADSASPPETSSEAPVEEKVEEKTGAAALRKLTAHPTTAVMVREALTELDTRKGVSSRAIQNFIKEKYPSVDSERLKNLVKKNLRKGIETGTYVRPAKANVTAGAAGMFRLAPKDKVSKAKSENTDPNVKVTKATKDGDKKPKKTGTTKKGEAVTKEAKKKDPKPPKKSKDEENPASKPAPAKKPKAKKAEEKADDEGTSDSSKTKDSKTAKGVTKTTKAKAGAASQSKATKGKDEASAPKAPGKRGKKTAE